jgi:hypothetical protein
MKSGIKIERIELTPKAAATVIIATAVAFAVFFLLVV